jgi:hypothetical protein
MRALLLVAFTLLAACGRPLTPTEKAFLAELHGADLDTAPVRLHENGFVGAASYTVPTRPRLTCQERIYPPIPGPTATSRVAGVALYNHLLTSTAWTTDDYARDYPAALNLPAAMFLAHEMTHVWQWQNRARTGYSPFKAAAEHQVSADPYLFDPQTEADLLSLGYEQQAAIVEEYVCCRTVAPTAARTQRLYDMLRRHMPVARITPDPGQAVLLPWDGVELAGICD